MSETESKEVLKKLILDKDLEIERAREAASRMVSKLSSKDAYIKILEHKVKNMNTDIRILTSKTNIHG